MPARRPATMETPRALHDYSEMELLAALDAMNASAPSPKPPVTPPAPVTIALPAAWIPTPPPPPFTGTDRSLTAPFLAALETSFLVNPSHLQDDQKKVWLTRPHLTADAAYWFDGLVQSTPDAVQSWAKFKSAFRAAWGVPEHPGGSIMALTSLKQVGTVANYTTAFTTLAAKVAFESQPLPDRVLTGLYFSGLSTRMSQGVDTIRMYRFGGLDGWPSLAAIQAAALDFERTLPASREPRIASPPAHLAVAYTPNRGLADKVEAAGGCRYCKALDHRVDSCPAVRKKEERKKAEEKGRMAEVRDSGKE